MELWTFGKFEDKVRLDLDLEGEKGRRFISTDEMVGYCNSAINQIEARIVKIYEDYFLTDTTLTIVANQAEYDVPEDIYALKFRGMVFDDGHRTYPIKRLPRRFQFERIALANHRRSETDFFNYYIKNSSTDGYKIVLVPTPLVGGEHVRLWYIRNAQRVPLVQEGSEEQTRDTVIDIPEASNFILHYMKVECLGKEDKTSPAYDKAVAELALLETNLVDTLTNMVPDDDTDIVELDTSHYEEHE